MKLLPTMAADARQRFCRQAHCKEPSIRSHLCVFPLPVSQLDAVSAFDVTVWGCAGGCHQLGGCNEQEASPAALQESLHSRVLRSILE